MHKAVIIAIILSMAVSLLLAAEPVAYLMKGKGSIQIIRNEKTVKYATGDPLYNNDQIKTGGDSYAALKYLDGGATLKVFPNSMITITATKDGKQLNKATDLSQGSFYAKINSKIKGTYQVDTPTTVASVKGTGFVTKLTLDKKTLIIVLEGEVAIQNKSSGKKTSTKEGNTTISDEEGNLDERPTKPSELSGNELQEIESTNQEAKKTMKVQFTDENGATKYIIITY